MKQGVFDKIKRELPKRYAFRIAQNIEGVSMMQVRLVFRGKITDPEKVKKVKAEAYRLKREHKRLFHLPKKQVRKKAS